MEGANVRRGSKWFSDASNMRPEVCIVNSVGGECFITSVWRRKEREDPTLGA